MSRKSWAAAFTLGLVVVAADSAVDYAVNRLLKAFGAFDISEEMLDAIPDVVKEGAERIWNAGTEEVAQ